MKGTEYRKQDALEELFRHASARERPPTGDEQIIREALHAEWKSMSVRRNRRRLMISLAAAASVVLAVFLGSDLLRSPAAPAQVLQLATVEKVLGSVFIHPADTGPVLKAEVSRDLETGQQLITGRASRLALRWADGTSLRIDQNSEVSFTMAGEVALVSGRLYADTESVKAGSLSPVILTPAGPVRHLGTQYMTDVTAGNTLVSVRKGRVVIGEAGAELFAGSGEQLSVKDSGVHSRKVISAYGDLWQWTQELASAFESDGRTMAEYLEWVGRESGHEVAFASGEAEKLADETLLRGRVELEPMRSLTVMLQTTDLVYEVSQGTIIVAARQ